MPQHKLKNLPIVKRYELFALVTSYGPNLKESVFIPIIKKNKKWIMNDKEIELELLS